MEIVKHKMVFKVNCRTGKHDYAPPQLPVESTSNYQIFNALPFANAASMARGTHPDLNCGTRFISATQPLPSSSQHTHIYITHLHHLYCVPPPVLICESSAVAKWHKQDRLPLEKCAPFVCQGGGGNIKKAKCGFYDLELGRMELDFVTCPLDHWQPLQLRESCHKNFSLSLFLIFSAHPSCSSSRSCGCRVPRLTPCPLH